MSTVQYSRALQLAGLCLAICLVVVPQFFAHLGHTVGHEIHAALYLSAATMGFGFFALGFIKKDFSLRNVIQLTGICLLLCTVSICHYLVSPANVRWHEILQRAYYLPIVFAALWYGSPGGLLTAALAAVLYVPHILATWKSQPEYQFNQYAEVALFFVFGGLTGVLSDRQRKHRAELEQAADKLRTAHASLQESFESLRRAERLSALGTLSAALAHEIRSPLSAIEGAVDILGRANLGSEQRHEFTAVFKREIERLNGLLYQFLEFAQPRPSMQRRTDIHQLVGEVCNLVGEMASARKITLVCPKADLPFPKLEIDPDQIKEVLLNLVMNACEAMPEGGKAELFLEHGSDRIIVGVRDEGVGIQQGDFQRIFDPFYTTKAHGTGLGLSIAQRIMEQHGGRIEAARNPERGMTFTLVFPAPNAGE
jgi:signal transduction histidine kinase